MELGDLSSLTGNLDSQLSYLESLSRVVRAVAASSHSLEMSEGGLILPKMITKKKILTVATLFLSKTFLS